MSLINDALKKAERERALEKAEGTTPPHGGRTRIAKRGAPMRTQTVLTIVAGAVLLVVVSAVLTGVFVTRSIEPKPAASKPAGTPAPAAATPVLIVANIPILPASQPAQVSVAAPPPRPAPRPQAEQAQPFAAPAFRSETAGPSETYSSAAAAVVATLPPAGSSFPPPPAPSAVPLPTVPPAAIPPSPTGSRHDPHIQALVDGFHVTGIRSAGSGSKVLMNERVYRVDDIVDYGYGLKLTTVAPDRLTFVDAGGETYVKNF